MTETVAPNKPVEVSPRLYVPVAPESTRSEKVVTPELANLMVVPLSAMPETDAVTWAVESGSTLPAASTTEITMLLKVFRLAIVAAVALTLNA